MDSVSAIKLIRTDTTLDLSQKAEKGMMSYLVSVFYLLPGDFRSAAESESLMVM